MFLPKKWDNTNFLKHLKETNSSVKIKSGCSKKKISRTRINIKEILKTFKEL